MDSFNSYPKVYAIGHRATTGLFSRPVIVEEKIDGSQFSFGVDVDGTPHCRSRGQIINVESPEKMFSRAVESFLRLAANGALVRGWTYRAEYLQSPKHNTLSYSRTPVDNLVVFDVATGPENYLCRKDKEQAADDAGLECVPLLHEGVISSPGILRDLLERDSMLGGCRIEGVVVKPSSYDFFGEDKKPVIAKYVSESFKEKHGVEWKKSNPGKGDVLDAMVAAYASEARWSKAVQHLRESGSIGGDPRDIGALINAVKKDIEEECAEEIAAELVRWALPKIQRGAVRGLPEWYKGQLLDGALSGVAAG